MFGKQLIQLALLASTAVATPLDATIAAVKDKSGTAMVNLKNMTGAPQNLASGALYGLPQNENQIPSHFFTDIGFNFARAGGSQLPAKGWIENVTSYEVYMLCNCDEEYVLTLDLVDSLHKCLTQLRHHKERGRKVYLAVCYCDLNLCPPTPIC